MKVCNRMCNGCPFSTSSMKGFLGGYTLNFFRLIIRADFPFPCHKELKADTPITEVSKRVLKNEINVCRGYVECLNKSAKQPRDTEFLALCKSVQKKGMSKKSMAIWEFEEHHKPFEL